MHALTCTATDTAGNGATTSVSYLVGYRLLGVFSPVPNSKLKAGQTVPIKVAVADADGVRVPHTEAQALLAPTCRLTFNAGGAQSASSCMKYDTKNHQFVYDWKLGQQPGEARITITIGYPGTTGTTTLSETVTIIS